MKRWHVDHYAIRWNCVSAVRLITEVRPEYPPDRRRSALSPAGCPSGERRRHATGPARPRWTPGPAGGDQREAGRDKAAHAGMPNCGGQPVEEEGFGPGQAHREEQGDSAGPGWGTSPARTAPKETSRRW